MDPQHDGCRPVTGLSNTYFKLYNSILMDVKFMGLSRDAMAIWTLCAVWCSANLTDGRIPEQVVNHMCLLYPPLELSTGSVANAKAIASDLLDHGLWEEVDGGYRMHDWADYQNTREEVEHIYEVRREAGSKGGRAKKANSVQSALTRDDRELSTGSVANAKANAVAKSKQNLANGKQTCSKTYPDTDTDTDTPTSSLRSSVGGPGGGADSEHPLVPAPVDDAAAVAPAAPPARRDDTKPAKGSRLPDGWTPSRTEANLRAEDKTGGGPGWLTDQLERFRDYWTAQAGTKGVKRDWDATWRNWIRRSATDFQPPQQQMKSRHQQETDAWYARTQARIEANDGKNPLLELIEGT